MPGSWGRHGQGPALATSLWGSNGRSLGTYSFCEGILFRREVRFFILDYIWSPGRKNDAFQREKRSRTKSIFGFFIGVDRTGRNGGKRLNCTTGIIPMIDTSVVDEILSRTSSALARGNMILGDSTLDRYHW
jgi:hypothetical protein